MDSRAQHLVKSMVGLPAFAVVLMLSATVQAATNAVLPCDQVGRDMQSLDVQVDELTLDRVDHAPVDPNIVDVQPVSSEPVAPVLNLGSRLSKLFRDVFGEGTGELPRQEAEQSASSPLADSLEQDKSADDEKSTAEKSTLPRFQRQMLRTDI